MGFDNFFSGEMLVFCLKIFFASISGLLIGLEREIKGKSAGLKTNALVSLGACVFVIVSLKFQGEQYADVTRVLSQVVTGVGFLGAGVILQQQNKIKGLTTAATIWCSAGAGCLAATAMYSELIIFAICVIVINIVFGFVDAKIENRR
ncbi:MgtC/SapB family protein [Robertkochia solimangrovi]|uniref:MgtC/SapB family protein n=1 Tax=Robertkochia solimangrovi TaxID=2213046 RepID=UPI00117EB92E|nr:MgtC/SapB family protein [Robertkochia solimangrovi]TRZ45316.1 MgtC/SapB family protein [Robertkochia solimangrovi]